MTVPSEGPEISTGDRIMTQLFSDADLRLIRDYVAGRLDGAELETFEARLVAEPGLLREVEITEALRKGLRALSEQGEFSGDLVQPQAASGWWRQQPLAVAALALLGVSVATNVTMFRESRERAATAPRMGERYPDASATTIVPLLGTRSSDQGGVAGTWSIAAATGLIALQVDVSMNPADRYQAELSWVGRPGRTIVLKLGNLTSDAEGLVTITLNPSLLAPGEFELAVFPAGTDVRSGQTHRLRVDP